MEGCGEGRRGETGGEILGLAAEDDGAGRLYGTHVLAVEDRDGDWVGKLGR